MRPWVEAARIFRSMAERGRIALNTASDLRMLMLVRAEGRKEHGREHLNCHGHYINRCKWTVRRKKDTEGAASEGLGRNEEHAVGK